MLALGICAAQSSGPGPLEGTAGPAGQVAEDKEGAGAPTITPQASSFLPHRFITMSQTQYDTALKLHLS